MPRPSRRSTTRQQRDDTAVRKRPSRKPREKPSDSSNGTKASQTVGTISTSASSETEGNPATVETANSVTSERTENIETNERTENNETIETTELDPGPVGITSHCNARHNPSPTTLARKRKALEIEAAEALAKIQEEEDMAKIEFEKKMYELQQRRLQREKMTAVNRLQYESSLLANVEESSSRPATKRLRPTSMESSTEIFHADTMENNFDTNFGSTNSNNNFSTSITHLAQAITTAIHGSSGNDEIKKFVARQAHSKELSPFSGDPEEWPSFISEYRSSNMECKFSNIENMARLKHCLKGKAREVVKSMLIVPDNIDKVLHTLEINFGRPDLIISTLIQNLQQLPSHGENRPDFILTLSNSVLNLVSTMTLLDETGHLQNPQLLKELEGKLPMYAKVAWARTRFQIKGQKSLIHFSEWLQEFAETMSPLIDNTPQVLQSKSQGRERGGTDAVMTIMDNKAISSTPPPPCVQCHDPRHDLSRCPKFLNESLNSRWKTVMQNKICFCCLQPGHHFRNCKLQRTGGPRLCCGVDGCKMSHHRLLHNPNPPRRQQADTVGHIGQDEMQIQSKIMLKVLPIKLRGPQAEISTYAFLDDGSTTTLLDKTVAEFIGAGGPTTTLNLRWTNNNYRQRIKAEILTIQIVGEDGEAHEMSDVKAIPGMKLPRQFINIQEMTERWQYLQKVPLSQLEQGEPKILIGQDHWDLIQTLQYIRGPKNAPALSRTTLGWVLHGIVPQTDSAVDERVLAHWQGVTEDEELHQLVKTRFTTEDFGVKNTQIPKSKDEQKAQIIMEKTAKLVNKRWEIGQLWKDDDPHLPESKSMAMKRLLSVEKKLDRDPALAKQYVSKMQDIIAKGYARKLSPEEAAVEPPRTWYLPHFAVTNPNKPGKIRLVLDAAAKSHGWCFNDFIHVGPDKLRPLISILFNFRVGEIAFGGDIREMFPQIKMREEDRCAQRFLYRGMDRHHPADVYEHSSLIFGAASSPTISQEIKNRNALEFISQFPAAVQAILWKIYMDDYYDSKKSKSEAAKIIKEIIFIFQQGGFEMCNWVSNSKEVLETIPQHLRAHQGTSVEISDMPAERVLGMHWDPNEDVLIFTLQFHRVPEDVVKCQRTPTKREILKLVMSIFDPLGLICHLFIRAKILLQDIWRAGIGWDDQVTNQIFIKWQNWLNQLVHVTKVRIPRCYSVPEASNVQLHIFCDASEKAFAAVAYFRIEKSPEEIDLRLVIAKTRVAPLRPLTIPRLELQAAVMGSRLYQTVLAEHELTITSTFLWSDSQTVLRWINSDARRYNSFVAHRIGEIMETTDIQSWRWLPSEENVADDATRDDGDADLSSSSRWFLGPRFLRLPPEEWPANQLSDQHKEEDDEREVKAEFLGIVTPGENPGLPEARRFSSWTKLIRVTAWILRIFRKKTFLAAKPPRELTVKELEEAETLWFKQIQKECYSHEISKLEAGKEIFSSSRILQLNPKWMDGLLRGESRIQNSREVSYGTKNPIILDGDHYVTQLLIRHYHLLVNHNGQEQVVNELRQKYWIPAVRQAVRKVWNSCVTCKLRRTLPRPPEMAPLPSIRVTQPPRPFAYTGVDFFGPMEVTVRRRKEMRYGVIFVCMSTRAVHLEIAQSLSTDAALPVLQRFISLRLPEKIFSDNGRNLRGAERKVKEAVFLLNHDKIQGKLTLKKVDWIFIPPASPHMGGSWESLIKSVKKALESTLKERAPTEETLRTLFAEAQSIVNGHPLTHVPVDPVDPESLTPNHFILGVTSGNIPHVEVDTKACLSRQWKLSQKLADSFWKRWVREYLPSLTRRTKWFRTTQPAKVGDLVLIADDNLKRNLWPRGVITSLCTGKDGVTRVVDVKTNAGEYRRPLSKICILDVQQE